VNNHVSNCNTYFKRSNSSVKDWYKISLDFSLRFDVRVVIIAVSVKDYRLVSRLRHYGIMRYWVGARILRCYDSVSKLLWFCIEKKSNVLDQRSSSSDL
jgi:hypothetical protein